jgi:hypothetical protein
MQPRDRVAMFPKGSLCGQAGLIFSEGFGNFNPGAQEGFDPSDTNSNAGNIGGQTFTKRTYDLGFPQVLQAGEFTMCFCPSTKIPEGEECDRTDYFILEAATLNIVGPDQSYLRARAGVPFHLLLAGVR